MDEIRSVGAGRGRLQTRFPATENCSNTNGPVRWIGWKSPAFVMHRAASYCQFMIWSIWSKMLGLAWNAVRIISKVGHPGKRVSKVAAIGRILDESSNEYQPDDLLARAWFVEEIDTLTSILRAGDRIATGERHNLPGAIIELQLSISLSLQILPCEHGESTTASPFWADITSDFGQAASRWALDNHKLKPEQVWHRVPMGSFRSTIFREDCVRLFAIDPFSIDVFTQAEHIRIRRALQEWLGEMGPRILSKAVFSPVHFYNNTFLLLELAARVFAAILILIDDEPDDDLKRRIEPILAWLHTLDKGQVLAFAATNLMAFALLDENANGHIIAGRKTLKDIYGEIGLLRLQWVTELIKEHQKSDAPPL
ncbi:MAG: hypothetical protein SGI88_05425 [Candidatus Hydrogenedentes bacterium]|nr:hypothetical protein [Candidatus Hydrogenedentota bacterium]